LALTSCGDWARTSLRRLSLVSGVAEALIPPSTWLLAVTGPFCAAAAVARTSARVCMLMKLLFCSGALSAPAAKAPAEVKPAAAIRAEAINFVFMMKILKRWLRHSGHGGEVFPV
jgi:hypothetical protein